MAESEDRTQTASPRRRLLAREQGKVAHSPELTAAVGWIVAVAMLAGCQSSLFESLVALVRSPLVGKFAVDDPDGLASLVRQAAWTVAFPLGVVLSGFAAGAICAHQIQTRGLFTPSLAAPDLARLWRVGQGGGLGAKLERCVWSVVKAAVLTTVAVWGVRSRWGELRGLSFGEFPDAAQGAFAILLGPAWALAVAMLAVGVIDYGLRYSRYEAMLRMSPDEQREDQRTLDGDPKVRASRRRLAHTLRDGTAELLEGATFALLGDAGLVVVLSGGPPPRKVFVRVMGTGRSGATIRGAVQRAKLPSRQDPSLAHRIASAPARSPRAAISDPLSLARLRGVWPA